MEATIKPKGRWIAQKIDKDGSVVDEWEFNNGVVNGGLDDILSVYLASGTQKTTWYAGLINASGYSTLAAADTIASHSGWSEYTSYSQSTRPQWSPGAVSGQAVSNGTVMTFSFTGSVSIQGAFLVSNSTKGGTTGTLFCTGVFDSAKSFVNGQSLKLTYTVTAAAG